MIPEIREKIEVHIKQAEMKMAYIFNKYQTNEQMNVKDLSDIERLSHIIKNLIEAYKHSSFII